MRLVNWYSEYMQTNLRVTMSLKTVYRNLLHQSVKSDDFAASFAVPGARGQLHQRFRQGRRTSPVTLIHPNKESCLRNVLARGRELINDPKGVTRKSVGQVYLWRRCPRGRILPFTDPKDSNSTCVLISSLAERTAAREAYDRFTRGGKRKRDGEREVVGRMKEREREKREARSQGKTEGREKWRIAKRRKRRFETRSTRIVTSHAK